MTTRAPQPDRPPTDGPADAAGHRLRPCDRIKKKREFDAVFAGGKIVHTDKFTVRHLTTGQEVARLGLIVGKRHGNAVRRNRMKRLLREVFRLNRHLIAAPCDLVIVPRSTWRELSLASIEPLFRKALTRVNEALARE